MRIGFVGTGAITSAMVRGLCIEAGHQILVSPRSTSRSAGLATEFEQVTVAADNQAVLDACDTVVIAVRPAIVADVLAGLRFRAEHRVVSLVATLALADVRPMVEPATEVMRAAPLPPCARRAGCVLTLGGEAPFLADLGEVLNATNEREFNLLMAATALIAPTYRLLHETADWCHRGGVDRDLAERYLANLTVAIASDRLQPGSDPLLELALEAATPGGLNETATGHITDSGGFDVLLGALDSVVTRLGETPPPGER